MLGNYLQQTTSADDIFRCIFFLGALRVNHLDSSVGRVSAFRAGAHGLESKLHQPNVYKMILAAPLMMLA